MRTQVLAWLADNVSSHRLQHILGVEQMCCQLAQQHGINPEQAATAGLLHADVSAIMVRDCFRIKDKEILTAIRNHTLGNPQMSPLSCLVFVADALEPNRGSKPELEAMRRVSWQNLSQSVQQTCDYSLKHLINTNRTIHPRAILTRNWALQMAKQ